MNAVAECPQCGLPLADHESHGSGWVGSAWADSGWTGSNPDSMWEDKRRIEELTREVRLLQKTVAQLRAVRR